MASLPLAPEPASDPADEESQGVVDTLNMSGVLATEEELENEFMELDRLTLRTLEGEHDEKHADDDDDDPFRLLPLTAADNFWLAQPRAAIDLTVSDEPDCSGEEPSPHRKARPLDPSDTEDETSDVQVNAAGEDESDAESEWDIDLPMVNACYTGPETHQQLEVDSRPAVPSPPAVLPLSGRPNCFDPAEPFDEEAEHHVFAILDRGGDRPYRYYLVQWFDEQRRFVATWEWETMLRTANVEISLNWIHKWKDEYPQLPFVSYRRRFPIPFTANTADILTNRSCFFRAILLACRVIEAPLITTDHIDKYIEEENARRHDAADAVPLSGTTVQRDPGVTRDDILRFTKSAIRQKAPLAGQVFKINHVSTSSGPGACVAYATASSSDDDVSPPFVMREAVRAIVVDLIDKDECKQSLPGHAAEIGTFITNIASLTPAEKKLCIFASLAILDVAADARPTLVRTRGERRRFRYYAPFIGRVCQKVFLKLFGISAVTLARYKAKVRRGWL